MSATLDSGLRAQVVDVQRLEYAAGPDAGLDRPAHVRAGSSLTWIGERLAVVQDDASFLALVEPSSMAVTPVTLPAGPGGVRQFDDRRRNKRSKLDGEACFSLGGGTDSRSARLFVLGSGSRPERERVLVIDDLAPASGEVKVSVVDVSSLYAALRSEPAFAGSELNLEGAAVAGPLLRLLQRGNGAVRCGVGPVDAIGDLELTAFLAYVASGGRSAPPPLLVITPFDLGNIGGARLGFTDAVMVSDALLYLAAGERSPDTYHDGEVRGVAIGIARGSDARFTPLLDPAGDLYLGKAEGVALARDGEHAFVVVDHDDPSLAAELCRVELRGFPSGVG